MSWDLSVRDWRWHAINERGEHPTGVFTAECGQLLRPTTPRERFGGIPCEACAHARVIAALTAAPRRRETPQRPDTDDASVDLTSLPTTPSRPPVEPPRRDRPVSPSPFSGSCHSGVPLTVKVKALIMATAGRAFRFPLPSRPHQQGRVRPRLVRLVWTSDDHNRAPGGIPGEPDEREVPGQRTGR